MMSSSPESAGVQPFEYTEAGRFDTASEKATAESRPIFEAPGTQTSDQLESKLAAARAEGIREGLQQAQQSLDQQLAGERAKVAEAVRDFAQKTSDYYSRAEAEMVHLSLAIAAKILHREVQVDRMLVAALVKVALEKLQHGTTASVRVRPEEVADWNRYFEGDASGEIRVEVKPDSSVAAHNCILETELGTTELGLDVQLKEIEQGFFDLLAQRPDNK
jgi:flagellar assembly protein FliH